MASSVTGTDKFLQLVPIFSPRPTMSGIFHKFGSISRSKKEVVSTTIEKLFSKLKPWLFCFWKTPGNVEKIHISWGEPPLARGETLSDFTQIGATFIQYYTLAHWENVQQWRKVKWMPLLYNDQDRDLRPLSDDCCCVWGPMITMQPAAQHVASCDLNSGLTFEEMNLISEKMMTKNICEVK